MTATAKDIAVIGLGVMGRSLALNLRDHGATVVASDPFEDVAAAARPLLESPDTSGVTPDITSGITPGVTVVSRPAEALALLSRPRKVLMMVKAGDPVDALIDDLAPHLEAGDILIDGGNTHFRDTERRQAELARRGVHLVGLGVSGGEDGARFGPALMAGGDPDAVGAVTPLLSSIAAKAADGAPCYAAFGPGGAGHFVKMAHNGIEYALMQTLAEAYLLMDGPGGLTPAEMADHVRSWAAGPAASYLLEITATVLDAIDEATGRPLIEVIRDTAGHKGTGRWTIEAGLELGVAVPGVAAAFLARALSARRPCGMAPPHRLAEGTVAGLERDIGAALPAAMLAAYAQGLALIREAAASHGWGTDLAAVARTWRGGCIIRAGLLEPIADAYRDDPGLLDLPAAPFAADLLAAAEAPLRQVVTTAVAHAAPVPALAAALAYLDGLRAPRLGASLIQAQRDLFGAHTFERIDRAGSFHRDWPHHA